MSDIGKQLVGQLEQQRTINNAQKDAQACWSAIIRDYAALGGGSSPVCISALLAYGSQEARACITPSEFEKFCELISKAQQRWAQTHGQKTIPLAGFALYLKRQGVMV